MNGGQSARWGRCPAVPAPALLTYETEVARSNVEDGDVGNGADIEVAEVGPLDVLRRVPRAPLDDLKQSKKTAKAAGESFT